MASKNAQEIDQDEIAERPTKRDSLDSVDAAGGGGGGGDDDGSGAAAVTVHEPDFQPLKEAIVAKNAKSMEHFYDVRVPVWAELGRVEVTIGELLQIGEGSVLRLERPVGEPVDLVSQGVTLARGEVVVVDDCFAIRIKEIHSSEKK